MYSLHGEKLATAKIILGITMFWNLSNMFWENSLCGFMRRDLGHVEQRTVISENLTTEIPKVPLSRLVLHSHAVERFDCRVQLRSDDVAPILKGNF